VTDFDIVIATCDRHKSLKKLIGQIFDCSNLPRNLYIVDSSDQKLEFPRNYSNVEYIHSPVKNQPLQRYIGFTMTQSEIVVFLDDDVRITDKSCFDKILKEYKNPNVYGVQPSIKYQHVFFDSKIPSSPLRRGSKKNTLLGFLKALSGNPTIPKGKFWLAGLRSSLPSDKGYIEWFNGPVFSARKKFLYLGFNFNLFELYNLGLGKGEDAILGFTLSRIGSIKFQQENTFLHEDQEDSKYSKNLFVFYKRMSFSRMYLSFEYSRQKPFPFVVAFLHYNLYIIGRLITLMLNQLYSFDIDRFIVAKGYLKGYFLATKNMRILRKIKLRYKLSSN